MPPRRAIAALAALATALAAPEAGAYCRATTCEASGVRCDPPTGEDCGEPLRWSRRCIGISVQTEGSFQISRAGAKEAILAAFGAWEGADCGGTTPAIHVEDLGYVDCSLVEYNGRAGNANLLVFRDGMWPHAGGPHNIALTTVTFDTGTGEIYDADIEVNASGYTLTTTDPTADYDLVSILTHEAGHFLGIAHSPSTDATMFAVYGAGTVDFRSISPDDANAICAAYPPGSRDGPCNPIPRHGFSPACADDQLEGDCAITAPGEPGGRAGAAAVVLALAACASRRARLRAMARCARRPR